MIFIIGGEHQGKLNYALSLTEFKNEDVIDYSNMESLKLREIINCNKTVLYNFNILIKELLRVYDDEEIVKEKINNMFKACRISVVISNEIGYGIVPMDKFERRYRELTGRICCDIAKESKEVHRVVCGIGTIIKGGKDD
ncbi:bifunctional adenosylcobinamide kinase/adenosylcobinamide-phosphate guanylyltransferase [uncultured Clostridium sp.]|uniref:bifunctional adenosylcobinamide kinase/adenosylcobinamide-phosphate guanylyltransferase n=1 Tax=uncultured Clostridium sp. TaxID=59620 RepID=UPI0025F6D2BB|nr:bifunctional adenosylcobinamide kinase/adenosylcobinamide-phosphate guanylyltransferase [uncultured Clostridium sp.]